MAVSDALGQNYVRNITGISKAFQPMDPNVLSTALSSGGALSGSLGFGEGGIDVLGLTPDEVNKLVENRGTIQQQNQNLIAGAAALSDLLSGNKETRAALQTANRDIYKSGIDWDMQQDTQLFQGGQQDERLADDWQRLKADHEFRNTQNIANEASAERRHKETMQFNREKLNLEKRRQTAIEKSLANDSEKAATFFPASPEMFGKYETAKEHYLTSKDYKNFAVTNLQQKALGTPYGSYLSAGDFAEELSGYKKFRLAPNGWYGVNEKDGKVTYSPTPIVPLNSASIPRKGGAGKSMVPVYGAEE